MNEKERFPAFWGWVALAAGLLSATADYGFDYIAGNPSDTFVPVVLLLQTSAMVVCIMPVAVAVNRLNASSNEARAVLEKNSRATILNVFAVVAGTIIYFLSFFWI